MNKTWLIILIIVILLVIFGLTRDGEEPTSEEPIKVGALFGLTGFVSFTGEMSRDGFLMAIEDSGVDVDYVIEDFQSDLANVVTAANKLINVDEVSVVIGPEWNEFGEVVAPIADEEGVLFVSPWMTGERDWVSSPYFFSATPSERHEIRALVKNMEENGRTKIALAYSNNAWAFGVVDIFKEEINKRGSTVELVGEFEQNSDSVDYRTDISKIKALNPDAVYTVMASNLAHEAFAKQSKELGSDFQMYVPFSRAQQILSEGNSSGLADGVIYPAAKEHNRVGEFNKKYQERFGRAPVSISAGTAYDMTTLVLNAIKNGASSTEGIVEYLRGVKDYNGYSNVISFDDNGQIASEETELRQIQGDSYIVIE